MVSILLKNIRFLFYSRVVFYQIFIPHFLYLPLVGGHLDWSCILAIVSWATGNISEWFPHMLISSHSDTLPGMGLLGHTISLSCLRNLHTVLHHCTNLHSHSQWNRIPSLPPQPSQTFAGVCCCCCYLPVVAIVTGLRWNHCGFHLHFPDGYWWWSSFHVFLSHLQFFKNCSFRLFASSLPGSVVCIVV